MKESIMVTLCWTGGASSSKPETRNRGLGQTGTRHMGRAAGHWQALGVNGILNLNLRPSLSISNFKFNLKIMMWSTAAAGAAGPPVLPAAVLPITCQIVHWQGPEQGQQPGAAALSPFPGLSAR